MPRSPNTRLGDRRHQTAFIALDNAALLEQMRQLRTVYDPAQIAWRLGLPAGTVYRWLGECGPVVEHEDPRDTTGRLCGDPLPLRSALARRP